MIRHSRRRAGGSTGWRVHPLSTGGTTSCWMSGKGLLHPCPPPSLSTSGPRRVRRRVHEGARTDARVVGLERRGEVPRVRFLTPHQQRRFATGGRCSSTVSRPDGAASPCRYATEAEGNRVRRIEASGVGGSHGIRFWTAAAVALARISTWTSGERSRIETPLIGCLPSSSQPAQVLLLDKLDGAADPQSRHGTRSRLRGPDTDRRRQ